MAKRTKSKSKAKAGSKRKGRGGSRPGAGRPTDFKPQYAHQAEWLCERGATDQELSEFFDVTERTINRWKLEHPEFCQSLKAGKDAIDDMVERKLLNRALGYTFDSEKVFQYDGAIIRADIKEHVPPDTTAMIFWLKNRRPSKWRDKIDHTHEGGGDLAQLLKELQGSRVRPKALIPGEVVDGPIYEGTYVHQIAKPQP